MNNFPFERFSFRLLAVLSSLALYACQPAAAANCVPPPAGLVGWWPGEGNAFDVTGANNGVLQGNTHFGPGAVGEGFMLDGLGDAVVLGYAPSLQLQNFSIEGWIRRFDPSEATFGTHTTALFFGYGSQGYGFGIWNDGRLFLTRVDVDNVTSTRSITDTNFHHVAVTKSGPFVIFYIDGVPEAAVPYSQTFIFASPAAVGARADTMDDSFLGAIDDLAVFASVLSASDVLAIYNAGSAGKCRAAFGPQIVGQPVDQAVYSGDDTSFSVSATGDDPMRYQWRLNSLDLPGQTNATLSLSNVQTNDAGVYSVRLSNAGGSLTSSNATLKVMPRPPCTPRPPGLLSWWRAETNAFDEADGNHGTLVGDATYGAGRVGTAFAFDGSQDAVLVGNAANLQLQDFTIEGWIKRADASIVTRGTHTTALFFGYGSGGYGFGMFNDGRLFLTKVDVDNVNLGIPVTDTTSFHHVAVTKSGANVTFYIDGLARQSVGYTPLFSFSTPAAVGARGDTMDDSFLGEIDELAVYSRALDSTEIAAIYNADGAGKCKDPVPPRILTQPGGRTAYIGDSVTLTVVAYGDQPLSYQWLFNGTNLPGRTSTSLIFASAQVSNAGVYSIFISNAISSIVSSNALLSVIPRPPCTPAPPGLVSWWRAENDANDNWDSNNNSENRLTVLYTAGKVGRAFNFTSSSHLDVPDSSSLQLTNALTIEAWVNPTSASGTAPRTILGKFDVVSPQSSVYGTTYYLGLTNNGSVLFMLSGSGSSSSNAILMSPLGIPTNEWTFITATYDGADMKIYINGNLAAQTNYTGGIFPGSNATVGIGALAVGYFPLGPPVLIHTWPFLGLIDELSLYNRALDGNEIRAIYNADVSGKCLAAPLITGQPQNLAVPVGEDALFRVTVLGSRPLRYQWRLNGLNVFGATNATLLLEHVKTNQAGNYSVFVSNALGSQFSSTASLTLLPPLQCVPAPPDIVSWWPEDGTPADVVGTNNARVSVGFEPLPYIQGKSGLAFNLSNNLVINPNLSQISAANSPSLNFGSNADFSIEGWIKRLPSTSLSIYTTILDKRTSSQSGGGAGYSLLLNEGRLAFWMGTQQTFSNSTTFASSNPDLRDGMFHHVAVSLHRTATNGGNLYVDGNLVLTFDPTARQGSLSNTAALLFGSPATRGLELANSNSAFNGVLDEFAIYRRALSSDEILAIHRAGSAGKCKAPPAIATQPKSQRVTLGSNATFTVTAAGLTPLYYQWFHAGVSQIGATNSAYSFLVQSNSGGSYFVRVSNVFASVTSSIVSLSVNLPPVAQPQQVSLNEDTLAAITLHGTDPQADPLTYSLVTSPSHGTLSGTLPNLAYRPATNYFGPDGFSFKVNDGLADSAPATVDITVLPVNDPPIAIAQSLTVNEDTPLAITLGAFDADNDPVTFTVVTPALHGTLSGSPPNLVYLAATNYNGPDSFTFKANDGQTDSAPATVSITILPVNDPPIAIAAVSPLFEFGTGETNLLVFSANNSNTVAILDASASSDVENDPLTYSWLEGTNFIGAGVRLTNAFNVGPHDITLQVSDGRDVGKDTLNFEVITAADSVHLLVALLEDGIGQKLARPLEASLNAAAGSFASGNLTAALNQLHAFQNKVDAQIAPADPELAAALIAAAQEIIDQMRR